MINRRTVLGAFGVAVLPPVVARAQSESRPKPPGKIGLLHQVSLDPRNPSFRYLPPAWQQLGYIQDESVLLRAGEGRLERLPDLAAELIRDGAGVLIVVGAEALRAAARVTTTTPIIAIDLETDPVESGYAKSLARPGGNVTGLFLDQPTLAAKWIELMREAVPGLERLAFSWHRATGRSQLDVALSAARAMQLEAVVLEITPLDNFMTKLATIGADKRSAVILLPQAGFGPVAGPYATAAVHNRLPSIGLLRTFAVAGMLMSYGPDMAAWQPRAVAIADQILRGAKAAETPIERPTRFEFVINMKTAKAFGLTIPPSVLIRADEVIE